MLGAARLATLAKPQAAAQEVTAAITSLSQTVDNDIHLYGKTRYAGTDSSNRPVYIMPFKTGGSAYIQLFRVNSDLTVTKGTAYNVGTAVGIGIITEQDGTNSYSTTNQAAYGYAAWKIAGGYGRGRVSAFSYSRDNLNVTSFGTYIETTRDTYTFHTIGIIDTRQIVAGGNGGNNGLYMDFEVFTRTDGSTTLTRNHALNSIGPPGQGTGNEIVGFGSDRFVHQWWNGNNGHGVPLSISKYKNSTATDTYDTFPARLGNATTTEFNAVSFAYHLNTTDKFLTAGWSNAPNGWDGYWGAQANTISWNASGTAPSVSSEGNVLHIFSHTPSRNVIVRGETNDKFYHLFFDYWDNRTWKYHTYTVSGTTITPDTEWKTISEIDGSGKDYTNFAPSVAHTIGGVTYMVVPVRQTTGDLNVVVVKDPTPVGGTIRTANTVTFNGNAVLQSTTKKFNYYAAQLDGSGDYLSLSNNFTLSGDFTLELWYNAASLPGSGLTPFFTFSDGHLFYIGYDGGNTVYDFFKGGSKVSLNAVTINTATWYHAACVRSGNTIKIYHNGTETTSGTYTGTINATLQLGVYSSFYWNGYYDEVRVSNVARYTSNFTPITRPFLPDSNSLLLLHMGPVANSMTSTRDDNGNIQYVAT